MDAVRSRSTRLISLPDPTNTILMPWHVYVMPPIDDWTGGFDRTEILNALGRQLELFQCEGDRDAAGQKARRIAQEIAVLLDWIAEDVNGEGYSWSRAPVFGALPTEDGLRLWAAGKVNNNGLTILVSQLELPWLRSCRRPYDQFG